VAAFGVAVAAALGGINGGPPARADVAGQDLSVLCILGGVNYGTVGGIDIQQSCVVLLSCDRCPPVPPIKPVVPPVSVDKLLG
jgi:hypothetical protein